MGPDLRQLLAEMVTRPEAEVNLAEAALLIAQDEYPDLDRRAYLDRLDGMGLVARERIIDPSDPLPAIRVMNEYLFGEMGFRGNTGSYYDPRNSFLNEVLDRRTGIPITLSVVYMEVGWRIGLEIEGVGLPGHFIVRCRRGGDHIFIDPFNEGAVLTEEDCGRKVREMYGNDLPFQRDFLSVVTKRQILARILNNLKGIYFTSKNYGRALAAVDCILAIMPDSAGDVRDRGVIYYKLEAYSRAIADLERYLRMAPKAADAEVVKQNVISIRRLIASMN